MYGALSAEDSSTARPIFQVQTRAISCRVRTFEFAPRREQPVRIIDSYYCGSDIDFNLHTLGVRLDKNIFFAECSYEKLSRKYTKT